MEIPFKINEEKKSSRIKDSSWNFDLSKAENIKVLLVDDNKTNLTVAKLMLKKLGVSPDIAMNGQEAIDKVVKSDYDIVLMDIQIPVMNGLDATIQIKQEKLSDACIVAVTANALEGDEETYLKSGFDAYLPKAYYFKNITNCYLPVFIMKI